MCVRICLLLYEWVSKAVFLYKLQVELRKWGSKTVENSSGSHPHLPSITEWIPLQCFMLIIVVVILSWCIIVQGIQWLAYFYSSCHTRACEVVEREEWMSLWHTRHVVSQRRKKGNTNFQTFSLHISHYFFYFSKRKTRPELEQRPLWEYYLRSQGLQITS